MSQVRQIMSLPLIATRTCQIEDCEVPHCPKCRQHYSPCAETAARGMCDHCIVYGAASEAEAITAAFGGDYEAAALYHNW